ncbi:type II secretion system protein GspL [Thiomicrorhabdus cannonii]|uniref:type II secretion system protein GspL n=1 Tax=Thiomicrorhabdus cannonii TaxID=2748011 RepID=UPI0015BBA4ED|nr:type II secretion system protein GspL [Thiomicrorhabdus cannonii]
MPETRPATEAVVLSARFDLQGRLWFELQDGWQEAEAWLARQSGAISPHLALTNIATVWVPSEQVSFLEGFVPGKRRADWLAALPFAFEEKLAEPLETLHLVVLNRRVDGTVSIAVVAQERMRQWVAVLHQAGLEKAALVADCFQVPFVAPQHTEERESGQGIWAVFQQPTQSWDSQPRLIVRNGQYSGFACQPAWWENVLALQPDLQVETIQRAGLLTDLAAAEKSLNLRSGNYAVRSESRQLLRYWRWPGVAALGVLGLYLLTVQIETHQAREQAQVYESQSVALFKQRFPEVKRIVNLRAQTKAAFAQTDNVGLSQGPMHLVGLLEQTFKSHNQVQLQRLEWKASAKQLSLHVKSTQVMHLQNLQLALEALSGLDKVELKVSNVSQAKAEGVLYVDAN